MQHIRLRTACIGSDSHDLLEDYKGGSERFSKGQIIQPDFSCFRLYSESWDFGSCPHLWMSKIIGFEVSTLNVGGHSPEQKNPRGSSQLRMLWFMFFYLLRQHHTKSS